MFKVWMGMLLLTAAAAFGGCDAITGGEDDEDKAPNLKNTTWFGPLEQSDGLMYRMTVIFDDSGDIGEIEIDEISEGVTGDVQHERGDVFGFQLADGTIGGFLVSGDHAAFITEDRDIGALQKDATALSDLYTLDDIAGTWAGYTIVVSAAFELVDVFDSEVTVQSSGTFAGSSEDGTTFESITSLSVSEALYGRYYGQSEDQEFVVSNVDVYLTPDMRFAGSQAIWGSFPDEVTFNSWEKQ